MKEDTGSDPDDLSRRRGRPVQMNSAEREAVIVRATKDLLMSQALDDVTMGVIAQKAGMSKRTIYEHFDSREDLLGRGISELGKTIFKALTADEKSKPLPYRLSLLLTLNTPPGSDVHKLEFLRTMIAKAHIYPNLARQMCQNGRRNLVGYILHELEVAVREGEIEIAADKMSLAAEILVDMVFGDPVPRLLDPECLLPDFSDTEERRAAAIQIFLFGCTPRS